MTVEPFGEISSIGEGLKPVCRKAEQTSGTRSAIACAHLDYVHVFLADRFADRNRSFIIAELLDCASAKVDAQADGASVSRPYSSF